MLTSNSYHSKYVWFISALIYIHNIRKILVILINDSSDSTQKEKGDISTKDRAANRTNIQPSCEYFSAHTRITLIFWFVNMLSYGDTT